MQLEVLGSKISAFNTESSLQAATPHEGAATTDPLPSRGQKALAARLPLRAQWEASTLVELPGGFQERAVAVRGLHRRVLVAG